jgi:UPF0716 protein FxsA
MLIRVIFIFILLSVMDLVLLLRIGQELGFWTTLWLVVLTTVAGIALAKRQGLRTIANINADLAAGRAPTTAMADGALILAASALLITPGFLTDVLGLVLLIPPVRRILRGVVTRWFQRRIVVSGFPASTTWENGNGGMDGVSPDAASPLRPVKHVENEALRK